MSAAFVLFTCFNSSLNILDHERQALKLCFVQAGVLAPAWLLVAVVSAFLVGVSRDLSRQELSSSSLRCSRALAVTLLLVATTQAIVRYFGHLAGSDAGLWSMTAQDRALFIATDAYRSIALSIHSFYMLNKSTARVYPRLLIASLALLLFTSVLDTLNYGYYSLSEPSSGSGGGAASPIVLNDYEVFSLASAALFDFLLVAHFIATLRCVLLDDPSGGGSFTRPEQQQQQQASRGDDESSERAMFESFGSYRRLLSDGVCDEEAEEDLFGTFR